MPQLIAIVLVGGVAWWAWRLFKKEMARVGGELKEAEKVRVRPEQKAVTQLEKGPDGVYRPGRDN